VAAAGTIPGLSLGIDVEWMAPNRRFGEISQMFLPPTERSLDILTFYRGWTFFEAHYKAFQRFPNPALVKALIGHSQDGNVVRLEDGVCAMQLCIETDFRACVVWRGPTMDARILRL
jgi:hypothetical protein